MAIEGSNGLSRPLEKTLREAGLIFYSFKPADTANFRKAVLGQNKDDRKDAESVARYAMALEAQGRLERYRRVWFADAELQLLSRCYERKTQESTAEVNRLWKLIRIASPDLYLALGGKHPGVELSENALQTQGILTLLSQKPDIGEWKNLSAQQMLEAMGGGKYKGRQTLIEGLGKVSSLLGPLSPAMALMIRSSAQQLQRFKSGALHPVVLNSAVTGPKSAHVSTCRSASLFRNNRFLGPDSKCIIRTTCGLHTTCARITGVSSASGPGRQRLMPNLQVQ